MYAAEGHDALIFPARALTPAGELSRKPFEINGVSRMLRFASGLTEIATLGAAPMTINVSGELVGWTGRPTIQWSRTLGDFG